MTHLVLATDPHAAEEPVPRHKSSISPTARTLAALRAEGWVAAIVEHWNSFAHIRQDLFGFADVIAFDRGTVLLVQCTDATSVSKRVLKLKESPLAAIWADCPTRRLEVWGWSKRGLRGEPKRWAARRVRLRPVRGEAGLEWFETEVGA